MKIYSFLLFLFIVLESCKPVQPLEFQGVESVNFLGMESGNANLQIKLKIKNPNNFKIKVKRYDLEGLVNNQSLGKIDVKKKIVIEKKSEQSYEVELSAPTSRLFALAPTLMMNKNVMLNLRGSLRAKAYGISKKFEIDIKEKVPTNQLKLDF